MSLSWGNRDVRVYAAEAWVSLAPRFAADHPHIVDQMEAMLADPVSPVRLQVARNLQVISVAAPEQMWAMAYRLAAQEPHEGVLASFLGVLLRQCTWAEPDHCEAIIEILCARMPIAKIDDGSSRDHIQEALGNVVAQLWAGQGRPAARAWLVEWAKDPDTYGGILSHYCAALRGAFFHRYDGAKDDGASAMTDRAQDGLEIIPRVCTEVSALNYAIAIDEAKSREERDAAVEVYQAAEQVTHQAMNQLYFGSSANANDLQPALGLSDHAAMKRFLTDYAGLLDRLAYSGNSATIHHLIELYEYLIPADPAAVFDIVHAVLLGPAAREGYHHESLAISVVVCAIRRYIADHRSIFDEPARRAGLVAILVLFSDVGWPDALKLIYDLPDLLR